MRFTRWLLSASLLVTAALLGCAGESTEEVKETTSEPMIDIQTPIGDVQVDSDGVDVQAGGVDVSTGSDGVDVQAGGVDVSTDSTTGEVSVDVEPPEQPAE